MNDDNELLPTRRSLLERLKNWDDQESWRAFGDRYWSLIYYTALKAGLTDAEAEDAVQETVISVSKSLPGFRYEERGSFKSWLLQVTSWRIHDQLRKRDLAATRRKPRAATSTGTTTLERVPDPAKGLEANILTQMFFGVNLRALQGIIPNRLCCQAQQGEWQPILLAMRRQIQVIMSPKLADLLKAPYELGHPCGFRASFDRPCIWQKEKRDDADSDL